MGNQNERYFIGGIKTNDECGNGTDSTKRE